MLTLNDLDQFLKKTFLTMPIPDYCPNGMQVEGKKHVQKVATAVSADLPTLEAAVAQGVDALIVHHGLFWDKEPWVATGAYYRKLHLLVQSHMALFAYHLPWDCHPSVGNNWTAARALGWEDLEPFGNFKGTLIGVRGRFAPVGIEAFVQQLESYYGQRAKTALWGPKQLSSAALISGGAYRELKQAALAGVDCFITGVGDEPVWGWAYEEGIHFVAMGHTATEKVGPKALAAYIQHELKVESLFLDTENLF